MLDTLDAAAVRRWCRGGLDTLRAHQREIDELNVYPVPDGDTGTNLVLTLTSAHEALAADGCEAADGCGVAAGDLAGGAAGEPDGGPGDVRVDAPDRSGGAPRGVQSPVGRALHRMARGALLGARGNSGVIVSQILRGMADALACTVAVRGGDLARALRSASAAAYAAVARPVEGTVLSVVAAAAEGAARIRSDDAAAVARAAAAAAAEALARTPQQLPVLARAGVVDAGGRGLCLLLDALVEALGAVAPPRPAVARPVAGYGPSDHSARYGFEVQYLLEAEPSAVVGLRRTLASLGDCLVVVGTGDGDPPTWNVHVHVDAIGAAIEAGMVAGRPHHIEVTPLPAAPPGTDVRGTGGRAVGAAPAGDPPTVDMRARAAVVVAAGDGLTALFVAEGATVVGRNPSTAEVLDAVRSTRAGRVVLLPNDANTHAVATAAAREAVALGVRVSVVPTRSPVQALAALAVRDQSRSFSDDVIAMAEAAGACRYGEVCTAGREALTVAGRCRPGDLLGLVDGEVHIIGDDLAQVCRRLLDGMLGGGGELVTLVLGAGTPDTLEAALRDHVAQQWPFVELQCYTGGQPRYHLLIGVE